MKIDNILLDKLTAQAKESPRLRMNLDLRTQATEMPGQTVHDVWCDTSQRMLNAIEPGSVFRFIGIRRVLRLLLCCVVVWWGGVTNKRREFTLI